MYIGTSMGCWQRCQNVMYCPKCIFGKGKVNGHVGRCKYTKKDELWIYYTSDRKYCKIIHKIDRRGGVSKNNSGNINNNNNCGNGVGGNGVRQPVV